MRPICDIARDIRKDWKKPNFAARPYLEAMLWLVNKDDLYGTDRAGSVVAYFLSNAGTYRGETAKRLKTELKSHL